MHPDRRRFLRRSAALSLPFAGLRLLGGCAPGHAPLPVSSRFGPLVPDPNGVLDLPAGFGYRVVSRAGDPMSDGHRVPALPDDMGAFVTDDGLTVLVRNHELEAGAGAAAGPFRGRTPLSTETLAFDPGTNGSVCPGGTTTLVWDTRDGRLVSSHLSLVGTIRNCSGGATPWGTWITCEEHSSRAGAGLARDHGYAFEVRPDIAPSLQLAQPLVAMGRFKRESVAVDPTDGAVYQTEDTDDGALYRFLPDVPGDLIRGGRLQALGIEGGPRAEIRNRDAARVHVGQPLATRWIDLEGVDPESDDLRHQAHARGAVRFARNEGICLENGTLWLCSTEGARSGDGQLWRYRPDPSVPGGTGGSRTGTLELFFESSPAAPIRHLDTLVPTRWGDLLVTEDGGERPHLAGITPDGELYAFARNAASDSELTGPTFSPDGSTLFLNLQDDGLTLALTGPWPSD